MTRVLQVVLSLDPGGTERLVVELVSRLHPEIPMAVCCLDEPGAWSRDVEARGIPVVSLQRQPGFSPVLARGVARAAREHAATVIHAHHYSPFVYSCLSKVFRPSTRVVFTEHGRLSDAAPSSKRRLANRLLATLPSQVYCVSADLRQHLIAEGFSSTRVGLIYNGIEVGPPPSRDARARVRHLLGAPDDAIVIGTVARLDPVKDLGTLIGASGIVARERAIRLVVIGDGPERQRLEALAAHTLGAANIRFTGHRDDARDWLAGCDLYVNSSVTEGVSLTILEAMAAALPIVATAVGGTPEIVDESCGRVVPPRDVDRMAAALRALADDVTERLTLGTAARRRVEERFTVERMVGEYGRVYASLTRRRPR